LFSQFRSSALFTLLLLAVSVPCVAEIRESRDTIVDTVTKGTLERLPGYSLSIPPSLATDSDVYVIIYTGAAVYEVRLLGRTSVSPQRLAHTLESALDFEHPGERPVEWSKEEDYSAALYRSSRAHFGIRASEMSIPLGKIVSRIREQGFHPHAVIRIPFYTTAQRLELPTHNGRRFIFYQADDAPPESTVFARAALSSADIFVVWFLMLGVPVIGAAGIITGVIVCRRQTGSEEEQRNLYKRLVYWPVFGSLVLPGGIGTIYMSSDSAAKIADLWLSSTMRAETVIFVMPNIIVFMVMATAAVLVQARLFPPVRVETSDAVSSIAAEEKRVRVRIALYSLIPGLVGLGLVFTRLLFVSHKDPLSTVLYIAVMLLACFGSLGVRWLFRGQLKALEQEESNDSLLARAQQIGRELNLPVVVVRVAKNESAQRHISIEYQRSGRVTLSRKCVEMLAPEELDFALAYRMALTARSRAIGILSLIICLSSTALLCGVIFGTRSYGYPWGPALILPAFAAFAAAAAFGGRWLFRAEEYRATVRALRVTCDVRTAVSALGKIVDGNPILEGEPIKAAREKDRQRAVMERAAAELGYGL
jgi:hypothetical protein